MKLLWTWLIKKLRSEESNLVKICSLRAFNLAMDMRSVLKFNWATQLREFLTECGHEDLFTNLDSDFWESKTEEVLNRYRAVLKNNDLEAYKKSSSA